MLRDLSGGTCIEILLESYFDRDKSSDSQIKFLNIIKGHEVIHLCFTVFERRFLAFFDKERERNSYIL